MKLKIVAPALMIILISACEQDKTDDSIIDPENLIANPSFETAEHQPDTSTWVGTYTWMDDSGDLVIPIVQDAPPEGGLWCLEIVPEWAPYERYAETIVTGLSGTCILTLTVWMKTIDWDGSVSLEQWRNGQRIYNETILDSTNVWKRESLKDTLTLFESDTLKVHLYAGWTESYSGTARFDLVSLEVLKY